MKTTFIVDTSGVVYNFQRKIRKSKTIYYNSNPLGLLDAQTPEDIAKLFNLHTSTEANIYSERSQKELRERATQRPGYPLTGDIVTQFVERREGKNINKDGITVDFTRLRLHPSPSICIIIYTAFAFIASSPNRDELLKLVQDGQAFPQIGIEMFRKIRTSETNDVRTEMGSLTPASKDFTEIFKDTFLDPNFVRTPLGFLQLLEFCTWLSQAPANYVKMVTIGYSQLSSQLPQLHSGHQTTFCAINTFADTKIENDVKLNPITSRLIAQIQLLPHNSYPTNSLIKQENLMDAHLLGNSLSKEKDGSQKVSENEFIETYDSSVINTTNVGLFMIKRVVGDLVNDSGMDDHPTLETEKTKTPPKASRTNRGFKQHETRNDDHTNLTHISSFIKKLLRKKPNKEISTKLNDFLDFFNSDAFLKFIS